MKNLLKQISELTDLAFKRAEDSFAVKNNLFKGIGDSCKFYDDKVVVKIREDTRHDCPDYDEITLTIAQLEMSDEEWDEVISKLMEVKIEYNKKKVIALKAQKTKEKHAQLEELANELGVKLSKE